MSLFDTLQSDMYSAMKSGEKEKSTTLRGAISKLKDKKIDKREDLTDQEEIQVLKTLVKQRKEAIEMYKQAERDELVEKEQNELNILEAYLPQMMGEEELGQLIDVIISETDASSMSDFGKVMPEVMKRTGGQADGKMAQTMVRNKLQ